MLSIDSFLWSCISLSEIGDLRRAYEIAATFLICCLLKLQDMFHIPHVPNCISVNANEFDKLGER
jgi:hypothetical protein